MKHAIAVMMIVATIVPAVHSQDETSLTRDEVSAIKKKLLAVFDALGEPPAGYAKSEESFNLPTEANRVGGGQYRPVVAQATRTFGSAAQMKAKGSQEDLQREYEKKMMEAQAKGDYDTMMKLSQEMQAKASQAHLEALEGRKDPIRVEVQLNGSHWQTIDPDGVVFEDAGVIALRFSEGRREGDGRVQVFFDPIALRDTKKLSKIEIKEPESGIRNKTAVLNVAVDLSGPLSELEGWTKRIAVKKVLAQIDGGK